MKTQKNFFLFFSLALCLLLPQCSHALALAQEGVDKALAQTTEMPPEERPICNLEATVSAIRKNPSNPDYYDVSIIIKSLNIAEAGTTSACDGNYAAQIQKAGQVLKASDNLAQTIQGGDSFKSTVQFTSDGAMTGYFLSDIEIISKSANQNQADQTEVANKQSGIKDDFDKRILGAFSLITLIILVGMIYSARDKTKKFQ